MKTKLKDLLRDGNHVMYDIKQNQVMVVWKSNCYPDYSVSYVCTNDHNCSMHATHIPLSEFRNCEYIGLLE